MTAALPDPLASRVTALPDPFASNASSVPPGTQNFHAPVAYSSARIARTAATWHLHRDPFSRHRGLRTTLHVVLYSARPTLSPRVALLLYSYACSAQEARLLQGLAWESTQLWNEIRAHGDSDSDSTRGNATSLNATLTS